MSSAAPLRLLGQLLLCLLGLAWQAGTAWAQQPAVVMSESGVARALLPLHDRLASQGLEVTMLGWRGDDGVLRERLPEGFSALYPSKLAASRDPVLPVIVRSASPQAGTGDLALAFRVHGETASDEVELIVRLPRLVVFELEAPAQVLAFPDRPTVVPVKVRNTGNAAGRARLSFSGMAASAPPVMVPAGGERLVHVELPPLAAAERILTVSLEGGSQAVARLITVTSLGSAPSDRYGVLATISAGAGTTLGRAAPFEGQVTMGVKGRLSRYTFLEASLTEKDFSLPPEPRFSITYRDTMLDLGDGSQGNPAGEVGRGIYLAQRFRGLPLVGTVQLGAALPLGEEGRSSRFGVSLDGPRIGSKLSLDVSADELTAEARASFAPFHASLRYSQGGSVPLQGRLHYATRELGAELLGTYSSQGTRLSLGARYSPAPTAGTTYSARLDLDDLSFSGASLSLGDSWGSAALSASPGSLTVEGSRSFAVGPASISLSGRLPLLGAGTGLARAGVTLPTGPLRFELGSNWTFTGALDARLDSNYTAILPSGSLTVELGLEGHDLLRVPDLKANLGVGYADRRGLAASLAVAAPLGTKEGVELGLGVSYSTFLGTPASLAALLDGPDPTLRKVRVELEGDGERRPVAGVRLLGCGQPATSGADGVALLSGAEGTCRAVVDRSTLPADTFLLEEDLSIAPGAVGVVTIVPSSELRIEVRYRDTDTGEILTSGRSRDVRVLVEGPVSRWATATLPSGGVRMTGLPAGEYRVSVVGEPTSEQVRLGQSPRELLLAVPAPPRTRLDPSAITPPVRLELPNLVVPREMPIVILVSSPAPIARVVVGIAGTSNEYEPPPGPTASWPLEVRVPEAVAAGAVELEILVQFDDGSVATRTLHVIVIGDR